MTPAEIAIYLPDGAYSRPFPVLVPHLSGAIPSKHQLCGRPNIISALNERYGGFSGGRIGLGEHVRRCGERIRYGEHALPGWIVDSIVKDFLQARNEIDYGGNVKTSGRMITSEQWNTLCTAYEKIAMWFKNECKVDMNDLEHVDFDIAAPAPTDRR